MRSVFYEAKKHLSFRETWVGYILAVGFLIISVKNTVYTIPDVAEQWNNIFQDIYTYGATLSAFLVAIGISRIMCYEHERRRMLFCIPQQTADAFPIYQKWDLRYCTVPLLL